MTRLLVVIVAWTALGAECLVVGARADAHAPAVAQAATPNAGRDVPDPDECRVQPRSLESLQALATPVAGGLAEPDRPAGTPVALPSGELLDQATLAAITATAREVIACENAGATLRTLALYSDGFLRRYFGQPGLFTESRYAAMTTPRPLPPERQVALVEVRDGRRLPDGRAGAVVVVDDPIDPPDRPPSASFLFFVEENGRWLVDDAFEVSAEAGATP